MTLHRRRSPALSPRNLQPGSKAYYQEIKRRRGLPTNNYNNKATGGSLTRKARRFFSYCRTIMLTVLIVLFVLVVVTPVMLVVIGSSMNAQNVPDDAFLPVQGYLQTAVQQHACQKLDEIMHHPTPDWLPNKRKTLPDWVPLPDAQALVERARQMAACRPSQIVSEQTVDRDSNEPTNSNAKERSLDDDATGAVDNTTTTTTKNENHYMDAKPKEAKDEVAKHDKAQEKPLDNSRSSSSRDEPRRKGPAWLRKLKSMLRRKKSPAEVLAQDL